MISPFPARLNKSYKTEIMWAIVRWDPFTFFLSPSVSLLRLSVIWMDLRLLLCNMLRVSQVPYFLVGGTAPR